VAGWDRYGRPLNAAGQLLPTGNASNERYAMGATGGNDPGYYPGAANEPAGYEPSGYPGNVPQYGRDRPAAAPPPPSTGSATARQPRGESSSDAGAAKEPQDIAAQLAAARAALQESDPGKRESESVVTQPVFNFLLLVSLVANAYLILTLSKLLQRYRHVVANMRSASASPSAGG
jgi:hypothetical protein